MALFWNKGYQYITLFFLIYVFPSLFQREAKKQQHTISSEHTESPVSRTVHGLRCLFYLQPNNLARHSFMNAGRTQGAPGSAAKDLIALRNHSRQSVSICGSSPALIPRGNVEGARQCQTHSGFCYRTLYRGKTRIWQNGKAVLGSPPKRDIIFVILDSSRQTCPSLWRETVSVSSRAVHSTNVLEKTVQNKGSRRVTRQMH